MVDYDSELRAHHPHLVAAAAVSPGERVLDVGCGAGQSTRDAGRAAAPGPVLGIDVDERLLEQARRRTEGLDNVAYVRGDAQVYPFPSEQYDIAISRFGTMFFTDPVAAFANIERALRPDGRLVMLVWQTRERNEWASEIDRVLGGPAKASGLDPFSLGDPSAARQVLAGLTDIRFKDVREPVFYGPDADAALAFVRGFQSTRDALAAMAPADAERTLERLRRLLDEHRTPAEGVAFDSRAWIITGRRAT